MTKLRLSMLLLLCILGTSFVPAYADNDLKATSTTNETTLSEDINSLAPRKRRKSKKRGGKRGGRQEQQLLRFGIEAGANMSQIMRSSDYTDLLSISMGMKGEYKSAFGIGFQGGAYIDINFSEMLFLEGGLYAIQRTSKYSIAAASNTPIPMAYTDEVVCNPMYLNIPILLGVNFGISDNSSFNIKAGPYIGIGISGKMKDTQTSVATILGQTTTSSDTEEFDFFGDFNQSFDLGLKAGLGFEFSKITLSLFMDYGFMNTIKEAPDGFSATNFSIGAGVGYKF